MSGDRSTPHRDTELVCSNAGIEAALPHPSGPTFYDLLGVAATADQDAIKAAYRRLAKAHHPDLNALDPGTAQSFARFSKAYRVLGDPHCRRLYDARLRKSPGLAVRRGGGGLCPRSRGGVREVS